MGTVLDGNLFALRRTGGALTLLSDAPVTSQTTQVNLPTLAPTHVRLAAHSRDIYANYPGEIAVKIRTDDPTEPNSLVPFENSGTLTLRIDSTIEAALCNFQPDILDYDTSMQALYYDQHMIFRSDYWTGGDDAHYDDLVIYFNILDPSAKPPVWTVIETVISRDPDNESGTYISQNTASGAASPNTTGAACIYNGSTSPTGADMTNIEIYANFTGKADYTDLLVGGKTFTKSHDMKVRHSTQAGQGLSAFPFMNPAIADMPAWSIGTRVGPDIPTTTLWADGIPYTFTPDDATWIGSLLACRVKAKAQFAYASPTSCDRLWWPGRQISLKVRYKKAEVIRTFGAGTGSFSSSYGYYPSLGSWSDEGSRDVTVTLPAYSSSPQLIGTQWDIPEVAGYVVAVDDIEITSVT